MRAAIHVRTHRSAVQGPGRARHVALFGLALLLLACAALTGASSVKAASGDLVKLSTWLPLSNAKKYASMELVRGPGGDLWLAATAGNLSTDPSPYIKRICIARYSAAGTKRWGRVLRTTLDMEYMVGFAVDSRRNAVMAGSGHWDAAGRSLWEVVKSNPSGKRLWSRFVAPPTTKHSLPAAVACDPAGGIYVVGTMTRAATGADVALVKYSPTGVRKWIRYLNGYEESADQGVDVAVDGSGRVYVTGTAGGFFTGTNILVARYTTTGKLVWRRDWDRVQTDDTAADLAVSAAGVAVAGSSADASGYTRGVVLHATPAMPQNADLVEHVTAINNKRVEWRSVATNASGAVACGGAVGYGYPTYFAYARYRPGAPDDLAWYSSSADWATCKDVWLGGDATLLAVGDWEVAMSQPCAYLVSDFVAAPDWQTAPVWQGRQERIWHVAASGSRAYVAGEAGDAIGLWTFER